MDPSKPDMGVCTIYTCLWQTRVVLIEKVLLHYLKLIGTALTMEAPAIQSCRSQTS